MNVIGCGRVGAGRWRAWLALADYRDVCVLQKQIWQADSSHAARRARHRRRDGASKQSVEDTHLCPYGLPSEVMMGLRPVFRFLPLLPLDEVAPATCFAFWMAAFLMSLPVPFMMGRAGGVRILHAGTRWAHFGGEEGAGASKSGTVTASHDVARGVWEGGWRGGGCSGRACECRRSRWARVESVVRAFLARVWLHCSSRLDGGARAGPTKTRRLERADRHLAPFGFPAKCRGEPSHDGGDLVQGSGGRRARTSREAPSHPLAFRWTARPHDAMAPLHPKRRDSSRAVIRPMPIPMGTLAHASRTTSTPMPTHRHHTIAVGDVTPVADGLY